MPRQILNGWKDISSYLNRGVRTAQRWELLLGMPVYRPALKDRSAVVAFSDELDRWLARQASETEGLLVTEGVAAQSSTQISTYDQSGEEISEESLSRIRINLGTLAWRAAELASQTRLLQEHLRRSIEIQGRRWKRDAVAVTERRPSSAVVTLRRSSTNDRFLAAG